MHITLGNNDSQDKNINDAIIPIKTINTIFSILISDREISNNPKIIATNQQL